MSMIAQEYDRMAALEETMWWYRGLHANIIHCLDRYAPGMTDLLDAGCGTGGMLTAIKARFPATRLHGVDISEQACAYAKAKSGAHVVVGSVDALPFQPRSFDAVISCDVLGYEMNVDAAMRGAFGVLKPGGHLVLNLAAYQWMLSYHDRSVGQVNRYTRSSAVALLREQGFHIIFTTYWNTILFPLMVIRRKLMSDPGRSDVESFDPIINGFFTTCLAIERLALERRMALPFGGSVLIIAQRPRT